MKRNTIIITSETSQVDNTVTDSSREAYHLYNEKSTLKGTSFKYRGDWSVDDIYYNDEYIIEFVSYGEGLYCCLLTNKGNTPIDTTNNYWKLVLSTRDVYEIWLENGHTGTEDDFLLWMRIPYDTIEVVNDTWWIGGVDTGIQSGGQNGGTFTPSISEDGVLSFTNDKGLVNPAPVDITGHQGVQGVQGVQGFQGFQGLIGPQGLIGGQGYTGDRGYQGFQGSQGYTGDRGYQGFGGPQGDQGFQGTQGRSGTKGDQGVKGATGDEGVQGLTGPTGAKGNQGTQGPRGFQGGIGTQGVQGTQGNKGEQGYQGAQGEIGDIYYSTFRIDPITGVLIMTSDNNFNNTNFLIENNHLILQIIQ